MSIHQDILGMLLSDAEVVISENGYISRLTYHNGKNLIENVTKDFNEKRINLRVEANKIKATWIG